jgi:hypothetical protein
MCAARTALRGSLTHWATRLRRALDAAASPLAQCWRAGRPPTAAPEGGYAPAAARRLPRATPPTPAARVRVPPRASAGHPSPQASLRCAPVGGFALSLRLRLARPARFARAPLARGAEQGAPRFAWGWRGLRPPPGAARWGSLALPCFARSRSLRKCRAPPGGSPRPRVHGAGLGALRFASLARHGCRLRPGRGVAVAGRPGPRLRRPPLRAFGAARPSALPPALVGAGGYAPAAARRLPLGAFGALFGKKSGG